MSNSDAEAERIRAEYARRDREIGRNFYSLSSSPNLFIRHGQERALQRALGQLDMLPVGDRRLLEVGCGLGQWFGVFENFGTKRVNIAGIDLDPARVAEATVRYPGADLRVGDATELPWADGTFDIVFQSTMFTSILDPSVRTSVATAMKRAVKRDGAILWYDFRYDNPKNPNVRGIGLREIATLFSGCSITFESVTLAPPVVRRVVPASWLLAALVERTRLLNTHYFAIIRPSR